MRVQSDNILLDFDIPDANYDSADASPGTQYRKEDNQVSFKPEKQNSSSISSQEESKEEKKEYPLQFADREGTALSADASYACKNQSAKQNNDCIVSIKGQAHKIRPMSKHEYRRWTRNCSSGLVMHRLNESYLSIDEKDSWKEISQNAQPSNLEDDKIEKLCKFKLLNNLTYKQ